jgi:endonuclease/exonuclease/phosphatase family metal-dependent hydrolase
MIRIVTWNIQCGLGADGVRDLDRIASTIRALADADVICLQEVARHDPELDDGAGADQVAALKARFFQHEVFFGAALDRAGSTPSHRRQFGNMILSRLPVLDVATYPLPRPAEPGVKHMRRVAIEAVIAARSGPLRVTTAHLEFFAGGQRAAQAEALRALHAEACANVAQPPEQVHSGTYRFVSRPVEAVLCGDFNFESGGPEYARITAPFSDGTPVLRDAWRVRHGERPYDPTCGIYDHAQWPAGPHTRDFFFVSEPIAARVQDVVVDTKTNASDHQPLLLVLDY